MRKLLYISLAFMLVTMVMGCGRSVDKRLVLADTLMWTNPDSSLAILSAINRDSLQGDENQAYYALLITQAQFRCNIPLTSDTLISKAVDYYSDNHNREHYTRALLYKGGAYEDMGNPVEAIKWYKQAEANADNTDYRNLAQINFRMGLLYYDNFASNNLDLDKFLKAAHYYELLNDKRMLMQSLYYCGNVLRITDINSARRCYDKGISIARELKDTSSIYRLDASYALMYIKDSLYSQAKKYIMEAYQLNNRFEENSNYYMLSLIYANQKDLDSAKYFISLPDISQSTAYDSLLMYKALKEIALCENDIPQYRKFDKHYYRISDSLEHNETKYKLHDSEQEFDKSTKSEASISLGKKKKTISLLIGLLLLISIVFLLLYLKKKKDSKRLIEEIRNENSNKYDRLNEELVNINNRFANVMLAQISVLKNIMAQTYNEPSDYLSKKSEHKVSPIDDSDKEFWNGLYEYLNLKYNNIIKDISKQHPKLSPNDLNIIGLMCCGFSDAEIAVCKGYRNDKSVKARRNKIRNKMNLDILLQEHLNDRMK
ncbi:MAG: hypothetical protein IKW83_04985 [Muribaculaceae bacterium]|nr:hypothetical protein [Muribaculaceae bacterium]